MKKLLVIGFVALIVGMMIVLPDVMLSPGDLMSEHHKLENECLQCHEPFNGIPNAKCITCHDPKEIGNDSEDTANTILFHSKLTSQECTSCHTDHKGLFPTNTISGFDHNLLSETDAQKCVSCHSAPVDSLHQQVSFECGNCHTTAGWKSSATFNHDMIKGADKNNCIACHQSPSDNFHSTVSNECSACHTNNAWKPSTFNHSQYFVLDGNHNTDCKTCHTNSVYTSYTCYGCHEHSESNIREEHQEEGITNFSDCVSCHRSGNEDDAEHGERSENNNGNEADQLQKYIQGNDGRNKDHGDDD